MGSIARSGSAECNGPSAFNSISLYPLWAATAPATAVRPPASAPRAALLLAAAGWRLRLRSRRKRELGFELGLAAGFDLERPERGLCGDLGAGAFVAADDSERDVARRKKFISAALAHGVVAVAFARCSFRRCALINSSSSRVRSLGSLD